MNEERLKILEMLQEGKISFDEAMELIKNISNEKNNNRKEHQYNNDGRRYNYQYSYDWIDDLRDNIVESTKNIAEYIQNQDFPFFDIARPVEKISYISSIYEQGINEVRLIGKNDKINISSHDENTIKLEIFYRVKYKYQPDFSFEDAGGNFSLNYDSHAFNSVGINVKIPKQLIKKFIVENKNSSIIIEDAKFNEGNICTKNAAIKMDNIVGDNLFAETKNGSIKLDQSDLKEVNLFTMNSPIIIDSSNILKAKLKSMNSSLKVTDSKICELNTKTSNGSIILEDISLIKNSNFSTCEIKAKTNNGKIYLEFDEPIDIPIKLKAQTSLGKIKSELCNLKIEKIDNNCIEAKTLGFDEANNKLNLDLQTTSSSIVICE